APGRGHPGDRARGPARRVRDRRRHRRDPRRHRGKAVLVTRAAALMLACVSCAAPAPLPAARAPTGVDPCVDFDAYANDAWRAANPIPDGKTRWGRRAAARGVNRRQLTLPREEVARRRDWPRGSDEQRLGDFYASCMDEAGVEAAGLTPLRPLLAEIDAARSVADVGRAIRRLHDLAIPVPFGVSAATDVRAPRPCRGRPRTAPTRAPGGRALPGGPRGAGPPEPAGRPGADADAILALEARLAEASLDPATAADPLKTDHPMAFADLARLAPHIDWDATFDAAKLPRVELNVAEPRLLQRIDRELEETPVSVWKAYLAWHLLASAAPWLPRPFVDDTRPRALRCLESTEALLGDALGRKYVERHFSAAAKAKMKEIVAALLAVLKEDVAGLTWMAPAT